VSHLHLACLGTFWKWLQSICRITKVGKKTNTKMRLLIYVIIMY
jgi:hypothetical protein